MKTRKYTFRKFINDIHLWMGLGSGIIIFLVCFSGTVLVFEHEIKDFFTQELIVRPTENKLSVNELAEIVKASSEGHVVGLKIPNNIDEPYGFLVKKELTQRRSSTILIDPYSGSLKKLERTKADGFLMVMFKLHRWLLLDISIGRPIVGVATIIFLLLSVSGIILWFPKKIKWNNFKSGFKIKTKANWKRVNHDLHNTLGFYSCILVLIMGITGLCWSFEGYRNGLGNLIGAKIFDRTAPKLESNQKSKTIISIDEAIALANSVLEYDGELTASLPSKRNNYFTIQKTNKTNWSSVISDKVYIDQFGTVLAIDYFEQKPLNVKIASLIKPIHTGEVYGMFSKIIYFIACLIATSLPVTGTIIWFNKLMKKKKSC